MYTTFKLNNDADSCGTHLCLEITTSYSKLVDLFGTPEASDEYKVSGEWLFESENGNIVTVYDWKETNLYDEDYPSVETFRQLPSATFHIGAHSKEIANEFLVWLNAQLG